MRITAFYIALLLLLLFQNGCTEPYEIEVGDFESVLVVESTITDELKTQIVKLSRTSTLDTTEVLFEKNASVTVLASDGESYRFSQDYSSGYYLSDSQFSAKPNISYILKINTQDGGSYTSAEVNLPAKVAIGELYAERIVSPSQDKDGVQVLVNTTDTSGEANYFRYEYEETYKVVAPYPSPYTFEITNYEANPLSYTILLYPREPEEICYSTEISTGINQISTTDLSENRVFRFPIRYLSKGDARIQKRYSILVKQYVQSLEAYTFYKTLKDLGSIGNILSQGQPGFVIGNITSERDEREKVLGFFEISSMSSKRIFFDYTDFGLEEPPYFIDCEVLKLDYFKNSDMDSVNERKALRNYLQYFGYQIIKATSTKIYSIVQPECSVCTYFSSNIKPDFWED
ncbi:DUF4249 domain-containing protein [Aequorivita sp. H23M31]|uniref:DUF4249 domain-containing protein n=1 Tax=Aequorivita ciconiae TaxID=2494375 RepID=A0A410G169_9FLAO|nr:DUF4249 domain-containing protein [Aequorivita sp. H23M31]QAA81007.1 DUF4249 domain-containing protein [Aequorivita sp. H23M31]